jgi:hypothetical protein
MFLSTRERAFLESVSRLAYSNPFLPERIEHERAALGPAFLEGEPVWSLAVEEPERRRVNIARIVERLEPLAGQLRSRLRGAARISPAERSLYEDAILQLLYQRYYQQFYDASFAAAAVQRWRFYQDFARDWEYFFGIGGGLDPVHIFACFRQIQRAFDIIFRDIIGGSLPAARLRASIWQSIFTHDMRRYRRTLYARMGEFATLITAPSQARSLRPAPSRSRVTQPSTSGR